VAAVAAATARAPQPEQEAAWRGGGGDATTGGAEAFGPPANLKLKSIPNVSGCSIAVRLNVGTFTLMADALVSKASLLVALLTNAAIVQFAPRTLHEGW